MTASTNRAPSSVQLRCGIVLRVREDACEIVGHGQRRSVRYATPFPSPRTERVSPGHLVAIAAAQDGSEVVIWRWFDAIVVGVCVTGLVRLWEPQHGEVVARPRRPLQLQSGTRAYLSAGLPGADWWVAGPATAKAEDAEVDLDQVERFYTERDLWHTLL